MINSPTNFRIGSSILSSPLVSILQIRNHLALLHAFSDLKTQIERLCRAQTIFWMPSDPEKAWAWFVGIAVERFERWCLTLELCDAAQPIDAILPPLDVIMVWHAYLLNPRWYAEDCRRIPSLQAVKGFSRVFAHLLSYPGELLFVAPCEERLRNWSDKTSLPFDYIDAAKTMKQRTICCPSCRAFFQVDLMNRNGTGYLQENFSTKCTRRNCRSPEITKATLGLRKLVEDLAASERLLAGTAFEISLFDKNIAERIKYSAVAEAQKKIPPDDKNFEENLCNALIEDVGFNLQNFRKKMYFGVKEERRRLLRLILGAYSSDKVFSLDLVGAVLRQGSFIAKMRELQWTKPSYFTRQDDAMALTHSIARYHAYLDLLYAYPGTLLVPTLDIDLAWHTHQLLVDKYAQDCIQYVGRFIDHNDKIEGLRLSSSFDFTCRLWKARFNLQYSYCGCPIPGESIGKKLSRLISISTASQRRSPLVPQDRGDLLASTHPSDHDAVHFFRQDRYTEDPIEKRAEKEWNSSTRFLYDEERVKLNKAKEKSLSQKNDLLTKPHDIAFLIPIPIYPTSTPNPQCVGSSPTVALDAGGCGPGTGGCGGGAGCGGGGGDVGN